jgi:hypothetical protein
MNTTTPVTLVTPELLSDIYDTLVIASDTNTLIVRESVEFRQATKQLIKELQATNDFAIGYENRHHNGTIPTNFITENIIDIWSVLHSVGQGDNSLSMKVRADRLATLIKNSPMYLTHQAELYEASI